MSWIRVQLRPVATLVLVALVALGGVSSASHAPDCHDEDCATPLVHDASAHAVRSAAADAEHPLHCVLCHWTRSTRPSSEPVYHFAPADGGDVRVHAEPIVIASAGSTPQPPLRSPPPLT